VEDRERLMALVVKAPLAIIRGLDERLHHFYRDQIVPSGLVKSHVDQLVEEGYLVDNGAKGEQPKLDSPKIVGAPTQPTPAK